MIKTLSLNAKHVTFFRNWRVTITAFDVAFHLRRSSETCINGQIEPVLRKIAQCDISLSCNCSLRISTTHQRGHL